MQLTDVTLIIPYYRQPRMLRLQLDVAAEYPDNYRVIVVDDGSPEPAIDVFRDSDRAALYRIKTDIPWNRGGARNLGVTVSETDWVIHVDTDHVLPAGAAKRLLDIDVDPKCWYRFPRFRVGKADETRRKDVISDECEFGEIKPHIDSYLVTKDLYWKAGGYNEDYSGCLGGGSPFLEQLGLAGSVKLISRSVPLHVYTRQVIPDASISTLSRDTSEYARRKARIGRVKGSNPLRFEWERVR